MMNAAIHSGIAIGDTVVIRGKLGLFSGIVVDISADQHNCLVAVRDSGEDTSAPTAELLLVPCSRFCLMDSGSWEAQHEEEPE